MNPYDEILALRFQIQQHNRNYYELDSPTISDFEYDTLTQRLRSLEEEHPELQSADSPTLQVGGNALFSPVNHEVPLESLNDVFSFEELDNFVSRVHAVIDTPEFVVEPKIDGLSVALTYVDGVFTFGATRGNGSVGEDVTDNLRTILDLPQHIANAPDKLIVRGEVYMPKEVFETLNAERELLDEKLFANPRNAAAGSLRQLDPAIAAARKLSVIVFNIQLATGVQFSTHAETLDALSMLGFPVVPYSVCTDSHTCREHVNLIGQTDYPYDTDGAVVKLNSLAGREILGSTSKAPRWAAAYKFPPEIKESSVTDITVQVGRTGVLTPKAVIEPIRLSGTTVTNATLHNQDFIDNLDVRIGDTVLVRKAGEIIPEVLDVVLDKRPPNTTPFKLPLVCPECGAPVLRDPDGVALRCTDSACPAQLLRAIEHFASRNAMDIDGLGKAIVESLVSGGLISSPAELYSLEPDAVSQLERMGQKSADNLVRAIADSKTRGLSRLLFAFGIRQVGQNAAKILASRYPDLDALASATVEELTAIPDIGGVTAEYIRVWFDNPHSQALVESLRNADVLFESREEIIDARFAGKTFVLTGALETLTRDEASAIIESFGGKSAGSVSKKTSYVVAGSDAGAKLQKAESLGIEIISEEQFKAMLL